MKNECQRLTPGKRHMAKHAYCGTISTRIMIGAMQVQKSRHNHTAFALTVIATIALKSQLHEFSYLWNIKDSSKMLSEIKRLVLAQDPSAKIYLYGARAKNSAKDESDWDLLILLGSDKITREVETSITYPLFDLEFETGERISPMVYSENEWNTKYSITTFYQNVMKEGKFDKTLVKHYTSQH